MNEDSALTRAHMLRYKAANAATERPSCPPPPAIIVAVLAAMLALSACGGGGSSSPAAPASESAAQNPAPEPVAQESAPEDQSVEQQPASEAAAEQPEPQPATPPPAPQYPAFTAANQIWNALPASALDALQRSSSSCKVGAHPCENAGTERAGGMGVSRDYGTPDGAVQFTLSREPRFSFVSKGGTTVEVADNAAMTATVHIVGDVDSDDYVSLGHWMTLRGEDFIASAPGAVRPVFTRDVPVEAGAFVGGPRLWSRRTADTFLPVRGSASYEGPALGLHATENGVSGFTARATLNAIYEFGGDRLDLPQLQGRVSNISTAPGLSIELTGRDGFDSGRFDCGAPQPVCDSGATIDRDRFYVDTRDAYTRLLKGESRSDKGGFWGATFAIPLHSSGHPAAVGGVFKANGVVDDVRHVFMGAYYADIDPESVR